MKQRHVVPGIQEVYSLLKEVTLKGEKWRIFPDCESFGVTPESIYVSSLARCYNVLDRRFCKTYYAADPLRPFWYINCYGDSVVTIRVQEAVARTWLKKPDSYVRKCDRILEDTPDYIIHLNGDERNNFPTNLKWVYKDEWDWWYDRLAYYCAEGKDREGHTFNLESELVDFNKQRQADIHGDAWPEVSADRYWDDSENGEPEYTDWDA